MLAMSEAIFQSGLRSSTGSSFDRFIADLHAPYRVATLGHGKSCSEAYTGIPGRAETEDSVLVYHPLAYSDVHCLSSKHLWWLYERLRAGVLGSREGSAVCPMEELIARHDSLVLLDLMLKQRFEGSMSEPSLTSGFCFDDDDDVSVLHLSTGSLQRPTTLLASALSFQVAMCPELTKRSTADWKERKHAHLLSLEKAAENDDASGGASLFLESTRSSQLSKREDFRIGRLIYSPTFIRHMLGRVSGSDTRSDEEFWMSGALSPHPDGYLGGGNGGITGELDYDDDYRRKLVTCFAEPADGSQSREVATRAQDLGYAEFGERFVQALKDLRVNIANLNQKWSNGFWNRARPDHGDIVGAKTTGVGQPVTRKFATASQQPSAFSRAATPGLEVNTERMSERSRVGLVDLTGHLNHTAGRPINAIATDAMQKEQSSSTVPEERHLR